VATQTTPESRDLQEIFFKMKKSHITHACIEVSSHALHQQRANQLEFDACVFTNLTQDHLDYHATFEDYYLEKEKLFSERLYESSKKNRMAIVGDDEFGKRLATRVRQLKIPLMTYGLDKSCDIHPLEWRVNHHGLEGRISVNGDIMQLETPLYGKFNLLNVMAAVGLVVHSGMKTSQIEEALKNFQSVPGRLEKIDDPLGRLIFVDYAHTPDALKNVLETVREFAAGKVITVFGCGGDRDRKKRPLMGKIAGQLSDVCLVTSDNPRTESAQAIIEEIIPGLIQSGMGIYTNDRGYLIEVDRKKAIGLALEKSGAQDVIIVAGKGHEDYQIIGKTKYPFSDQDVIRLELGYRQ
jgi:UDP-N-acetylmuramyl-tripeptide synthetase